MHPRLPSHNFLYEEDRVVVLVPTNEKCEYPGDMLKI